jgi:hypothetical protein
VTGPADDERVIAENEAAFRRANETLRNVFETMGESDDFPFLCECGDRRCTMVVRISLASYETIREHAARFLIVPGHKQLESERVVEETEEFQVVQKTGAAGEIARVRWLVQETS